MKKQREGVSKDLEEMEKEMETQRSKGPLSPEEETDMIKKELAVLKKCCEKLASIEEENRKLREERDHLKELLQGREFEPIPTKDDYLKARLRMKSDLKCMNRVEIKLQKLRDAEFADDGDETDELNAVAILRDKAGKYDAVAKERDALEKEINDLRSKLEEFELHKQHSQVLEEVVQQQSSKLEALSNADEDLKSKNGLIEDLEKEVDDYRSKVESTEEELNEKHDECEELREERDMLKLRLADMVADKEEAEKMRYRLKEAEVWKIERDRLKERVDQLENEVRMLEEKSADYNKLVRERMAYNSTLEELGELQCEVEALRVAMLEMDALKRQVQECGCTIQDQEDEIQRLLEQVDWLSQRREKQQVIFYAIWGF